MTNYAWNGSTGNWNNAKSWTPNGVPGGTGTATSNNDNYIDGMSTTSGTGSDDVTIRAGKVTSTDSRTIDALMLGGTLDITGSSLFYLAGTSGQGSTNSGVLSVEAGSTLHISVGAGASFTNSGRVVSYGAALIDSTTIANNSKGLLGGATNGTLTLFKDTITQASGAQIRGGFSGNGGITDVIDSTVTGGSIVARVSGGAVRLDGTTVSGAGIDTTNGGVIQTYVAGGSQSGSYSHTTTFNNISNTGAVTVTAGTELALSGTINNTTYYSYTGINVGDARSTSDTVLGITGNTTLTGGGKIVLSDNLNNDILSTGTTATLTSNNTISGAGFIGVDDGALSIVNNGTISATGTNALTVALGNTLDNTNGTLAAVGTGGLIFADTSVTLGKATIAASSTLNFGKTSSTAVSFLGGSGTLAFDHATKSSFSGTIANFNQGDQIDLKNISSGGATFSVNQSGTNTVLEVTSKTGASVADLTLLGTYSAGQIALSSDGSHGTLITTTHSSSAMLA